MNFTAAILLLLVATNVESKFVHSPYATINDNRESAVAVARSPYTTIKNNVGSTAVAKRKLSKKSKYVSKDIANSVEGSYHYLGSCASIYKVTIKCDTFGNQNNIDRDSDLCIFEEYNVGAVIKEEEGVEIPVDAIDLDNGLWYVPKFGTTYYEEEDDTSYEQERNDIDPNEVCILSGVFRHSSTVVVDKGSPSELLPIPLAKSYGCSKQSQSCCADGDTKNFQFVVKANILDNGDLDINFSSNYGFSYYTDNISTSMELSKELKDVLYVAQKAEVVTEHGRQLCLGACFFAGLILAGAIAAIVDDCSNE